VTVAAIRNELNKISTKGIIHVQIAWVILMRKFYAWAFQVLGSTWKVGDPRKY
jgi:hypothetical protein